MEQDLKIRKKKHFEKLPLFWKVPFFFLLVFLSLSLKANAAETSTSPKPGAYYWESQDAMDAELSDIALNPEKYLFMKERMEAYNKLPPEEQQNIQDAIKKQVESGSASIGNVDASLANEWGQFISTEADTRIRQGLCGTPDPTMKREKFKQSCWFCKPFAIVSKEIKSATQKIFDKTAVGAIKLIGVGMALWLLWTSALYFFKPDKSGEYIKKLGGQTLRAVIAVSILSVGSSDALNLVLSPFASLGIGYGIEISKGASILSEGTAETTIPNVDLVSNADSDFMSIFDIANESGTLNQNSLIGQILIPMNQQSMMALADGTTVVRSAFAGGPGCFVPSLELLTAGLVIALGSVLILFFFPLRVIDAMFRLGMVVALFPLLVASWVFKVTRGYAKGGWQIFTGSILFLMILSMTMVISSQLLGIAMKPYMEGKSGLLQGNLNVTISQWSVTSTHFMVLLATYIFCLKLITSTTTIAKEFGGSVGSGGIGMAAGIVAAAPAAFAGYKAGGIAASATKIAGKGAGRVAKDAGGAVLGAMK